MRAFEVFSAMDPEHGEAVLAEIASHAPGVYAQAMAVVGATLNTRPQYILKQTPGKRADMIRKVLGRVRSNDMAEEVLATYFIDVRKDLLVEWLDLLGLAHEEGVLQSEEPESPGGEKIASAVADFRKPEDATHADRELLLRAFAAQRAVDWPELEALLA